MVDWLEPTKEKKLAIEGKTKVKVTGFPWWIAPWLRMRPSFIGQKLELPQITPVQ